MYIADSGNNVIRKVTITSDAPTYTPTAIPTAIPTTAVPTLTPTCTPTDVPTTTMPTQTPTDNKLTLTSNSDNDSSPISYPEIAGIVIAVSIASALVAYYCYQRNRRLNSQVPKTENQTTTIECYSVGVKSI